MLSWMFIRKLQVSTSSGIWNWIIYVGFLQNNRHFGKPRPRFPNVAIWIMCRLRALLWSRYWFKKSNWTHLDQKINTYVLCFIDLAGSLTSLSTIHTLIMKRKLLQIHKNSSLLKRCEIGDMVMWELSDKS